MMTRRFDLDRPLEDASDLSNAAVSVAGTQCLADIELVVVEQTQMELAVSRQPHSVAGTAIRFAHWTDEADYAACAGQSIITRLVGRIIGFQLLQWAEHGLDTPA